MQALLLAALLAPPCSAAPAKHKPAPKKDAPAAPTVSTASAVAASTAAFAWTGGPLTVDAVLAHFQAMDDALVSLSAKFSQSLTMEETGVTSRVEGLVSYKKSDRLRIEHRVPEKQLVVSDGKDIWIWRVDRRQVIQSKLEDWKKADPAVSNLMEFGSYARMLKAYDVALDTAGARAQLVLHPKKPDASGRPFELRLTLAPGTLFPEATTLKVGSLKVETAFADLALNPVLDEKAFAFTPPADADVFRDFKPPKFQP